MNFSINAQELQVKAQDESLFFFDDNGNKYKVVFVKELDGKDEIYTSNL